VSGYDKIAFPLHALTRKKAQFLWSTDCQAAFEVLKQKLVISPLLAYPGFDKDFTLETDASKLGLGTIILQYQEDGKLHSVANLYQHLRQTIPSLIWKCSLRYGQSPISDIIYMGTIL